MKKPKNPLKEIREYFGYNQTQVGDAIGKKQSAYSDLENGVTKLTMPIKLKLAEFYKVDIRVFNHPWHAEKWIEYMNPEPSIPIVAEERVEYGSDLEPKKTDGNCLFLKLENEEYRAQIEAQKASIEKLKKEVVHLLSENESLKEVLKKASFS